MSDAARWVPAEVDLERPNAARMYDYLLGGAHNFEVDRVAIDRILAGAPEVRTAALANRAFLRRAVTHVANNGICQFVDLGSGIPTVGNVHEIAQAADPAARVVYVDNEPVAFAHARALLEDVPTATVIHADIREPAAIINHDDTKRLIDFTQPVGLLLVSVLHFVPGDITGLVADLRRPLAAGSYLVVSHATPTTSTAQTEAVQELYARTPTPLQLRSREQIRTVFDGFDLVNAAPVADEPADLVPVTEWRTDPDEAALPEEVAASPFLTGFLAGVGRVPTPQGGRR